jgi:hypothetical protein
LRLLEVLHESKEQQERKSGRTEREKRRPGNKRGARNFW